MKANALKNKWLHLRLNEQEYQQLRRNFSGSTERKLSAYARKILLGEPMFKGYRNLSAEAFLTEFAFLLKTLNGVANNFNQAVHKLHTIDHSPGVQRWAAEYKTGQETLQNDIGEIKSIMRKISIEWLR